MAFATITLKTGDRIPLLRAIPMGGSPCRLYRRVLSKQWPKTRLSPSH